MNEQILISGFGGQGILFAGKVLAYAAMEKDYNVSWLPSYGPEMRGGTANCSVVISDEPVACPIVLSPTTLLVFNNPSFEKFEKSVVAGGRMICDSSIVDTKSSRNDISEFLIPATELAIKGGYKTLANMVVLGKFIKESGIFTFDELAAGIKKSIPASKANLLDVNLSAVKTGMEF